MAAPISFWVMFFLESAKSLSNIRSAVSATRLGQGRFNFWHKFTNLSNLTLLCLKVFSVKHTFNHSKKQLSSKKRTKIAACMLDYALSKMTKSPFIRALASARGRVARRAQRPRRKPLEGPKGPRVAKTCESEGPKGLRTSKALCLFWRLPVLLYVFHDSAKNRDFRGTI